MSNEKNGETRDIKGWETTVAAGKGVMVRFLYPTQIPGKFEEGPWATLNAARCRALAEELLEQAQSI